MEMCLGVNLDMISDLPANVIDQILVRLPISEAVRTSVLSTKWRYKWTTIPELVFHDDEVLPSPHANNSRDKLINLIDRVLLLHSGFIHKFELWTRCLLNSSSIIDAWILFLSRKNIRELVLKFPAVLGTEPYKLPTSFFSAQQISTLELHWCLLKKPPTTFTGFSNLKRIDLLQLTVDSGEIECLISKCPVLERLRLLYIYDLDNPNIRGLNLNICSPNLKYVHLSGPFEDICFENTPLLSDVSISIGNISHEKLKKFMQNETVNVVRVLNSLPNLRKFDAGIYFLQFLSMSKIPEKLPFTCHHLNNLSMFMNFDDVNEICVALCLLNSSPNLRELNIRSWNPQNKLGHDIENFWEERTLIDWNMSGLQNVEITYIEGFKSELEFIKLLLANSPILEILSIISGSLDIQNHKGLEYLKELLIFPRASPKAKIKFLEQ